jgi:uncharacterized protein YjbI with pentapeptide repeats
MTAKHPPNISDPDEQIAKPVRTFEALLQLYDEGHRNFSGSDLRGATVDFVDSKIKVIEFRNIILHGSNLKAIKLLRSHRTLKVDLAGTDFRECNLQGADLSYCRLEQCNFTNSDLRRANLSDSSCRGSDFIQAKLSHLSYGGTDFTASDFTKADLRAANISGRFSHVNFHGANFYKASLTYFNADGADFSNADLTSIVFPTPTTVSFEYSYYNKQTKFSDDFDPISRKMELIEDSISADD